MVKLYRADAAYRKDEIYRGGGRGRARLYRAGVAYRRPQLYSAVDTIVPLDWSGKQVLTSGRFGVAAPGSLICALRLDAVDTQRANGSCQWGAAEGFSLITAAPVIALAAQLQGCSLRWREFQQKAEAHCTMHWGSPDPHARGSSLPWVETARHEWHPVALVWSSPAAEGRTWSARWGALSPEGHTEAFPWHNVFAHGTLIALPWSRLKARSGGIDIDWPVDPDPGTDPITIPELPVYVMVPTLTAVRLPDRTALPLLSVSIDTDLDSWAWSFSAPMSRSALDLVNPDVGDPPEIEVAVNGHVWTFTVDGYDDNRRFNSNTVTLRGRSRSALLAAPYAPRRTYSQSEDRTAAQLATEELTDTGWTMVWEAQDWLVPGGTFSYQDLTPMEAIANLAGAIGASVRSDTATKTITVSPAYAVSPWSWETATPYAILPAAVLAQGSSSWKGGTNPDAIYVYAENATTGAFVRITGSAGAVQLPMVVDRLVVHEDAQRERGRMELARHGRARTVQRTLPLFPSPPPPGMPDLGVVPLGSLVQVDDNVGGETDSWRGQVMAIRIDASRQGRALSVRQNLTIERQFR